MNPNLLYIIQVNAFSLFILSFVWIRMGFRFPKSISKRYFYGLVVSTMMVVLVDLVLQFFNGQSGLFAYWMNLGLTNIFYILNPVPAFLWAIYLDYHFHRDTARSQRLFWWLIWPLLFNLGLTLWTNQNGFMFVIDEANVYARGLGFIILALVEYTYMLFPLGEILFYRKKVQPQLYYMVVFITIPVLIGGTIQALFFGVYTLWASVSIGILIMYLNYEDRFGLFDRLKSQVKQNQEGIDIWNRD